jgi:hypothetical protein
MATEIEGRTLGKRSGALGAVAAQSLVLAILQSEQRYQKIYECFHVLYDLAHVTRYSAQPTRWIPADQVEKRVVKELVYPIENSARRLLAAASPPVVMPAAADIRLATR